MISVVILAILIFATCTGPKFPIGASHIKMLLAFFFNLRGSEKKCEHFVVSSNTSLLYCSWENDFHFFRLKLF